MGLFHETVWCRVCETRITVTATRTVGVTVRPFDPKYSVACPTCESTVSFDTSSDINGSTLTIRTYQRGPDTLRATVGRE
jgi:hypothetical protein